MKKQYLFRLLGLMLFPNLLYATPYYGAQASYIVVPKEPSNIHGYQLMLNYDPGNLHWNKVSLYFDGGFSHFWVTNTPYYRTINIYSVAPVMRYHFQGTPYFEPFLELSVGLSYLNHTHLDSRNLGIHFAFQDRLGIGAFLGADQHVTAGVHAVHYSNAHLSSRNSGLTALVVFDLGYRFS